MTTTYLCACAWDDVHTARQAARVPTAWPAVAPPPGVPLRALYFCETCYELRCNACVACEVSSRYCPHCLFEVPSTSARAQKAQCARSCMACPVCAHVVTIHGSDPPRNGAPLTSAEASIGVAPFYYACTACLWDSKRIGLVGAKPSALQASLPSASEPSAEQRAFDDLARHVAHHLGARPDADAARVPRVLADLPALPARYWQGRRAPPPPVRDELPVPAVHTTRAQSKQITREAKRAERLAPCTAPDTPTLAVSTLAQRYRMPLEQPYEAHALRPQRIRLRAKLAKRCATCTHLLVRPELRTSSSQFKLRRLARAYLPALHVARRTDDGVHVTLTNPLMDTVRVALASPHAALSTADVELAGAKDAWDVPPPPLPPGTDVWALGAYAYEHTATLAMRRAASAPPDAPVAVRVQWTVGAQTHAFWAMLPM